MNYLLFIIYLLFFCWLLRRIKFITNSGIALPLLTVIFLLKIAAGIFNGWVSLRYSNYLPDTWMFHAEGLKEYHLLFTEPGTYFSNIFHSGYETGYKGFFSVKDSYWNDLKSNLIIKLLSLFNIFSRGNYYTNVIFYNFIVLFGSIALYRVFTKIYAGREKILIVAIFLLPSVLYFGSSIHKEGLVLCALGLLVYVIYNSIEEKRLGFKRFLCVVVCCVFIFLQRNFVFLALLPALLAWLIAGKTAYSPVKVFAIVYIAGAVVFFTAGMLSPKLNLPGYVIKRQSEFLQLERPASFIGVDTLQPTLISFARNAPQAFNHSLLRPWLFEKNRTKFLYPLAMEIIAYQLFLVCFLFFRKPTTQKSINERSVILFGLFFSLSVLLIIGYTIPVIGAIVRYRSIYLPFILVPVLCSIDWGRIKRLLQVKK